MIRYSVAAALAVGLLTASPAAADPDDRLPYCAAGQRPTPGECKPAPNAASQQSPTGLDPGIGMGFDPGLPIGLNPATKSMF
jgi:hypothetical protein